MSLGCRPSAGSVVFLTASPQKQNATIVVPCFSIDFLEVPPCPCRMSWVCGTCLAATFRIELMGGSELKRMQTTECQ